MTGFLLNGLKRLPDHTGAGGSGRCALFAVVFCAFMFMDARAAVAHDGVEHPSEEITAHDVSQDRGKLKEFVRHAGSHLFAAGSFNESLELLDDFRDPDGVWRDDDTYLILLTKKGGVYLHAKQRDVEDQDWSKLLVGCGGESWEEIAQEGGCVKHNGQGPDDPQGHAFVTNGFFVPFTRQDAVDDKFVLVGGLDFEPAPSSYSDFEDLLDRVAENLIKDPELTTQEKEDLRARFKKGVSDVSLIDAGKVNTEDELVKFLSGAINLIRASINFPDFDPVIFRRMFRFEGGPWRSGSTYIYIMDDMGRVIFNGANRNIEQTDLSGLKDGDDPFIQRILNAAKGEGSGCAKSGLQDRPHFVCYNWDNPAIAGDEPAGGGAGGASSKLAYAIEYAEPTGDEGNEEGEKRTYVFGTGLYLEVEEAESDNGCSIAGPDATTGTIVTNSLFVLILVLLLGNPSVFRRKSI